MNTKDWQRAKEHKGIYAQNGSVHTSVIYTEDNQNRKIIKMSPIYKEVKTLSDYFRILKEIHDENKKFDDENKNDLFFYRGQSDINWLFVPSILRKKEDIKREHILYKEFHRRFYERFDACKTMLEEEVLMQHYGVGARCLDLIENPLVALWGACYEELGNKKSTTVGEVSVWKLNLYNDELKAYDSSTVSVIANTAKMNSEHFSLGHLEAAYHKEHPTEMTDFIYLKDILRRTCVVRPKYNNDRIRNQQGAFAIVNLNKMIDIDGRFRKKTGVSVEAFEKFILAYNSDSDDDDKINISRLRDGSIRMPGANFSNLSSWDIWFEKLCTDESNFVDFYDMYHYLYNKTPNQKNICTPFYIVVPSDSKKSILEELKYLNITKAYMYPEIESVAKEMKEDFGLKGYN